MTEENESGFDLSRRKVLGGVLTVGVASAGAGAGTMALFSDTESSTGNTVSAGTLDLTVNDASDIGGASVDIGPVAPGWSESYGLDLGNDGSIGGDLYIRFTVSGDDGSATNGDSDGVGLEDDLDLTWNVDGGSSGQIDLTNAPTSWKSTGQSIGGGSSVSGDIGLALPTSVRNEAQGESATIGIEMKLEQSSP